MSLGLVFHTPQSPHKGITSTSEGLQVSGGGLNTVPQSSYPPRTAEHDLRNRVFTDVIS